MKRIIAHRANLNGPDPKNENSLESIQKCFDAGFDVEIDVWLRTDNGEIWLGHDKPQYHLKDTKLLLDPRVWCHAKNLEAAFILKAMDTHWFWHQEDDFALTSRGIFWTYPGKKLSSNSVAVMPELVKEDSALYLVHGICTDWPSRYIVYQ
jgi:hypothetical protein